MQVTIKEIAAAAGVSPSTVSRALGNKGYVKSETMERIRAAAAALGYRPNALARSLVRKKSNTIGLIIPEIENPFYSEIISGVERVATKRGYSIILVSGYSETGEAEVKTLLERQVDGIIHGGAYTTNTTIFRLKAEGFPVVLLGRRLPGVETDCVIVNDRLAAYQLTNHFIKLGHRRLGYIFGKDESTGSSEKFAGFRQALADAGIELEPQLVEKGNLQFEGGYRAAQKLLALSPRPTALIAGNDFMALGARQYVCEIGLRIPADVALGGFDDILWSSIQGVELTTVAVPRYKMGAMGAELLIKKIEKPGQGEVEQIVLEPKLIIRRSCGYQG
ncbi:MAG: LacI family transcriptional regulator [Bacillota bacterium]|jgi:LacI family transcriptional regulator|nr:LacI family transcriptional regulator [Bacillota bacterium]